MITFTELSRAFIGFIALLLASLLTTSVNDSASPAVDLRVVPLEITVPSTSAGGLIAADVNDDGTMELLVTAPSYLGVYCTTGERVWSKRTDIRVGG